MWVPLFHFGKMTEDLSASSKVRNRCSLLSYTFHISLWTDYFGSLQFGILLNMNTPFSTLPKKILGDQRAPVLSSSLGDSWGSLSSRVLFCFFLNSYIGSGVMDTLKSCSLTGGERSCPGNAMWCQSWGHVTQWDDTQRTSTSVLSPQDCSVRRYVEPVERFCFFTL